MANKAPQKRISVLAAVKMFQKATTKPKTKSEEKWKNKVDQSSPESTS